MSEIKSRDVSERGFYYNLERSPYEWKSPYGDSYKLPSAKRLEMMESRSRIAINQVDKLLEKNNLINNVPPEFVAKLHRYMIEAVYRQIVG